MRTALLLVGLALGAACSRAEEPRANSTDATAPRAAATSVGSAPSTSSPRASASSRHDSTFVPPAPSAALPVESQIVLAWRPNGRAFAAAAGATLLLQPFPKGVALTLAHPRAIVDLVFSNRGDRLASVDDAGTVRLWDGSTGKAMGELPGTIDEFHELAFSADGKLLAAAGQSATIWRTDKKQKVCSTGTGNTFNLAFTKDQASLVTTAVGGFLRWNATTCAQEAEGTANTGGSLLVVRGSKAELVSGPSKSIAFTLDVADAATFDLSWDMKHIAGASAREVRVWDAQTGKLEGSFPVPQ